MDSSFDTLHARNQSLLRDLLAIDLDLAHTFLDTARATNDPKQERRTLAHVHDALRAIRHLFRWLDDSRTRREFERRAGQLEEEIGRYRDLENAPSPESRSRPPGPGSISSSAGPD